MGITAPDAPLGVLLTEVIGMFLGRLEFLALLNQGMKIKTQQSRILTI